MYWKLIIFLYLAANVALVSVMSAKMKSVQGIDNIKYWNSILLVISIALLTAFATYVGTMSGFVPMNNAQVIQTENETKIHIYSGVILLLFAVAMVVVTSMMIASSEYATCPQDIKNWIIATLVANVLLIVLGIVYTIVREKKSISQWFQEIREKYPLVQP